MTLDRAQEADGAFGEALRIARSVGDERTEAHASLGSAAAHGLVDPEGSSELIAELVERLLPKFEAWSDDRGLANAYSLRAQVHWGRCEFARAREDSARALPHARAAGDGTFERTAIVTKAIAGTLGPSSVQQIRADIEELQAHALTSVRGLAIALQAAVETLTGRFDEARRTQETARIVLREIFGQEPAGSFESTWRLETVAGEPKAALEWARRGYDQLMSFGDLAHGSTAAINVGISSYELGRFDDAWRFAEECRENSASDDAINQYLWRSVEAKLHAREGRFDEASALIREAVEIGARTDEFLGRSLVAFDEAEIAVMAGRPADARAPLHRALEMAEQKGATAFVDRATRRLAELGAAQ
jgi:tetratricopeptide (TPR) repeat protein